MPKTLKEMMGDYGYKNGVDKDLATPADIRYIKEFAQQLTNSLQPNIGKVLQTMEYELNKFGFSLGELEVDDEIEEYGEEDFIVLSFPEGREIKNMFLSLEWEKTPPQIYTYRPDKLQYSVSLSVNIIDPEDFDNLFTDDEVEVAPDDVETGDSVYGDDDNNLFDESVELTERESELSKLNDKVEKIFLDFKIKHLRNSKTELRSVDIQKQNVGDKEAQLEITLKNVGVEVTPDTIREFRKYLDQKIGRRYKLEFDRKSSGPYNNYSKYDLTFTISGLKESVEDLQESIKVKKKKNEINFEVNGKKLHFSSNSAGHMVVGFGDNEFVVIHKDDARKFVSELTDFLVDRVS